ncbi:MAG: O-antigen ligase family protein [Nitrospirota bacterium]
MNTHTSQYEEKIIPAGTPTVSAPSGLIEYGFYFYMCYTLLGGFFGLFVSNLASAVLILLVFFCLWEVGSQIIPVIRVIALPLGCGIAYSFIQLVFFEEPLTTTVRLFLIWMFVLFLIQLLALRANFLHRFALVMFFIGLAALPNISSYQSQTEGGTMQRVVLDRAIGFSHPNQMGAWYGFCTVYFVVLGITTKTTILRILSWLSAVGCLYVVTLTVSRGALLAVAVAIVVAGRQFLKRGFIPVLLVVCIGSIVVALGVFEQTAQLYARRGAEDTGRMAVWPLIIDSFLDSPLIGVGHTNAGATPVGRHWVTPHNGFLYLAQSSGVVPLALFIAYWLRVGRAALQADVRKSPEAVFYFPLLAYSFVETNVSAFFFMELWATVSLAIPMTVGLRRQASDLSGQVKRGVGLRDSR